MNAIKRLFNPRVTRNRRRETPAAEAVGAAAPLPADRSQPESHNGLTITCGWCDKIAVPSANGFHMCQIAFGSSQERYCFCGDDCFEAFRKMYPSRVHRNCYERSCDGCTLCIKRYENEHEGIRTLAKDYLKNGLK